MQTSINFHQPGQKHNKSMDATSSHFATVAQSTRRRKIEVRSQPRISKRMEHFRRMKLKDLRNDQDFMADVDE